MLRTVFSGNGYLGPMKSARLWPLLFFTIVAAYCLLYAPFGINETDGGFLSGLAWQVLSGKTLYADLVYVRPPLPVWLRALELTLLPEHLAVLGERWIFYLKVAAYSWLGAAVLARGAYRWQLAAFAFVLSVHCYPPAAWHTTDGLLFGALAIWCRSQVPGWRGGFFSGLFLVAVLLCKQSFYPMALLWLVPMGGSVLAGTAGVALGAGGIWAYLFSKNLLGPFLAMTTSATNSGQALQHGVLDYFRIQPVLAGLTVVLLAPAGWFWWKKKHRQTTFWLWVLWLAALAGSYAWTIAERQEFTAPFAQTRLLFWVAVGYGAWQWKRETQNSKLKTQNSNLLLALCWCASVSWGYNLPVLFAVPWAYAALEISRRLLTSAFPDKSPTGWSIVALVALLALFRWGYAWVYRDGPRAAMTEHLGDIFPKLSGIYSNPETAALYRDLDDLTRRYGPNVKTLPAFPQANFLTGTRPPLPLDWVVAREMGAGRAKVEAEVAHTPIIFLVEKTFAGQLQNDPEMYLANSIFMSGSVVEETQFFWVLRPSRF
ncbi:MAG: hypothetical protein JNJ90_05735 [Saprospiraceae bacterium]|nr:hypothetical protein [Saprospiraceae bacterium]